MRTERDFLGEMEIPRDALYGINSVRARENFPDTAPFHPEWYRAMATVKRACYITARDFIEKSSEKYDLKTLPIKFPSVDILKTLEKCALKCEEGEGFDHFIVPAVSGGAGTSINMNVNEILSNMSLLMLGKKPGEYSFVDPIESANIFQSTNDVVPTALKVAAMRLLMNLEKSINRLRGEVEAKEKEYRNTIRMGYTQMQAAVPTTYGRLFSGYGDALSRDWGRVSRCLETIKVVNLGGSAIGTSVSVPNYFVMEVTRTLQTITGLPMTRGENLSDATSNLDPFVEAHGILRAHAVNLEKMVNDLRMLGSDLRGTSKISIPKKQVGSSIMPSKVNPVIPEFVISSCHKIYANDQLISSLSAQGCLELNAYLPVIGHALLESLKLLIASNNTCAMNLVSGVEIDPKAEEERILKSPTISTLLLPYIGYKKSGEVAELMKKENITIIEANKRIGCVEEKILLELLKPSNLAQGSFLLENIAKGEEKK